MNKQDKQILAKIAFRNKDTKIGKELAKIIAGAEKLLFKKKIKIKGDPYVMHVYFQESDRGMSTINVQFYDENNEFINAYAREARTEDEWKEVVPHAKKMFIRDNY